MINDFVFDDFSSTVADTVHLSYPQQLILCFELFGYAFLFSEFSNKAVKHFCCFFVDICKVFFKIYYEKDRERIENYYQLNSLDQRSLSS